MSKYILLWELDTSRVPVDPKERGAGWQLLLDMVKADMQKGVSKDWGAFAGELKGYALIEGTEMDVWKVVQQYTPYCIFEVHPVMSVAQVDEGIKSMAK